MTTTNDIKNHTGNIKHYLVTIFQTPFQLIDNVDKSRKWGDMPKIPGKLLLSWGNISLEYRKSSTKFDD